MAQSQFNPTAPGFRPAPYITHHSTLRGGPLTPIPTGPRNHNSKQRHSASVTRVPSNRQSTRYGGPGQSGHTGFSGAAFKNKIGQASAATMPTSTLNTAKAVPRDVFKEGMIIWAPHCAPSTNKVINPNDPYNLQSTVGALYAKCRWMIILARGPDFMICLPLYTNSGRGIAHLPLETQLQHVGLKNRGDMRYPNLPNLVEPLDVIPFAGPYTCKDTAYVHLTEPCIVFYDTRAEKKGVLTDESYERMGRLHQRKIAALIEAAKAAIALAATDTISEEDPEDSGDEALGKGQKAVEETSAVSNALKKPLNAVQGTIVGAVSGAATSRLSYSSAMKRFVG